MIRFLLRVLAMVALAVAVIMAVLDATRTIAASQLVMTPLGSSWSSASPDTLASAQAFVEQKMHPLLWDPVIVQLLALPGFVVFGAASLVLYAVGRRPERRLGRFAAES
jgi:hypothetical protein